MKYFGLIVAVMALTQCSTAKQKGNAMTEFMKAIASGDITPLKTIKGAEEKDDGSWDEVK